MARVDRIVVETGSLNQLARKHNLDSVALSRGELLIGLPAVLLTGTGLLTLLAYKCLPAAGSAPRAALLTRGAPRRGHNLPARAPSARSLCMECWQVAGSPSAVRVPLQAVGCRARRAGRSLLRRDSRHLVLLSSWQLSAVTCGVPQLARRHCGGAHGSAHDGTSRKDGHGRPPRAAHPGVPRRSREPRGRETGWRSAATLGRLRRASSECLLVAPPPNSARRLVCAKPFQYLPRISHAAHIRPGPAIPSRAPAMVVVLARGERRSDTRRPASRDRSALAPGTASRRSAPEQRRVDLRRSCRATPHWNPSLRPRARWL